ncbi:hypothetical protein [Streptomyces sp. NPDC015131]|uniref:hypothetical protein n=1 Tax=Streptomyces sp. NPDC015131 TaxID=3364941 RepID=UPI0036FDBD9D
MAEGDAAREPREADGHPDVPALTWSAATAGGAAEAGGEPAAPDGPGGPWWRRAVVPAVALTALLIAAVTVITFVRGEDADRHTRPAPPAPRTAVAAPR